MKRLSRLIVLLIFIGIVSGHPLGLSQQQPPDEFTIFGPNPPDILYHKACERVSLLGIRIGFLDKLAVYELATVKARKENETLHLEVEPFCPNSTFSIPPFTFIESTISPRNADGTVSSCYEEVDAPMLTSFLCQYQNRTVEFVGWIARVYQDKLIMRSVRSLNEHAELGDHDLAASMPKNLHLLGVMKRSRDSFV